MRSPAGPGGLRVVVLGSHRAGTSLVARILQLLDVYLGEPERLLAPIDGDNDQGFFEHEEMMRLDEELLQRLGGAWDDPPALDAGWELAPELDDLRERGRGVIARDFTDRPAWGLKDPRLSLTLPFWRSMIDPTRCLVAHRSPLDVARSLERRNGIPLVRGVALWTWYTASAIAQTSGRSRLVVPYRELFTARRDTAAELAAFLELPDPGEDPGRDAAISDAVDPSLRHHAGSPQELATHPAVSWEARELFAALERRDPGLDELAARIVGSGPPRRPREPAERRGRPAEPRFGPRPLRIVAMLQVYNESRFMAACIEHLREQGVGVHVIDNESTDDTLQIAERYLGDGVVGIETLPRDGCFALREQCRRQEELAATLDADWLIHYDADEIRVSPRRGQTLAEAIAEFDAGGFNAVNFLEFAFVATREFPDHDHPDFARTMRWYYPFLPRFPHRCNAWKRQDGPVDLATQAGHVVDFPGLRMAPESLYMRHYLFVSLRHAIEKFVERSFAEDELSDGWFGWRSRLRADTITLPSVSELRPYVADHLLDPSHPLERHLLDRPGARLSAATAR